MQVIERQIRNLAILMLVALVGCAPRYARQPDGRKEADVVRRSLGILDRIERQNYSRETYRLFQEIRFYIGTPYVFGGEDRRGLDCSGFVKVIFRDVFGVKLPHNASQQYVRSQRIPLSQLAIGDLVFFDNSYSGRIDHVGIYLDDGYFVHASTSYGVVVSNLKETYYRSRVKDAGRVLR
ncbi:MAG: NlpC/P60 family protein [Calditrichaeota bacterium]|nr:NlpC/P60 family protein [Calditrichota bacterium]